MTTLTNEHEASHEKTTCTRSDHCHYIGKCTGAAHSIYNLKYNLPNKILLVFHNGLSHYYHFFIKKNSQSV